MNQSAWPAFENIREALERWFVPYPDHEKTDLRARFRKSDHNHDAAFFELYLHQVLTRLGLSPQVHPKPKSGKGRPDFAISGMDGRECYVEANVVIKPRWDSDDPLEDELLDAIDAVAEHQPTRIGVAVSTKGTLHRSHRRRTIQGEVGEWLSNIESDQLSLTDFDKNPRQRIQRDDWVAELEAFGPLSRPSRRLISIGPTKAGFSNEGPLVAKNLKSKAKKYGKLDRPLVLAINTSNVFTSTWDEHEALLGNLDGIWGTDADARSERLHAVLFFQGLVPSNMDSVGAHLYLNPNLQTDLPEELFRLSAMRWLGGKWCIERGETLGELLELPEDWPGEVSASNWSRIG